MSIATEISRIKANVQDAFEAAREKGSTFEGGNSDDLSAVIRSIPQGGEALINGRRFECGTFTFPAAVDSRYTIQHTLGVTPSAVFLWVVDPDYSVRGQLGKFRADSTTELNAAAVLAANGGLGTATGGNGQRYRTGFDSATITFECDSLYPLLPNMEYQWLAIA